VPNRGLRITHRFESGEDYLHRADYFVAVELPRSAEGILLKASPRGWTAGVKPTISATAEIKNELAQTFDPQSRAI
jgi:hypothetical protein